MPLSSASKQRIFGAIDCLTGSIDVGLSSVDPMEVAGVIGLEMVVPSESIGDASSTLSAFADVDSATWIARLKLNSLHSNGGVAPCSNEGDGLKSAPSSSLMMRVWNVGTEEPPAVLGRLDGRRIVERGELSSDERDELEIETGVVASRSSGSLMRTQVPTFLVEAMSIVPPF